MLSYARSLLKGELLAGATPPVFVAAGTMASSLNIASAQPPGAVAQPNTRFLLAVLETANQNPPAGFPTDGNGTPGTWNSLGSIGTGTAGTTGVKVFAYWKWGDGGGDVLMDTFVSGDSSDHQNARIFTFDGCDPTNPINATNTGVHATATTAMSCPAVTTTDDGCLIVNCIGLNTDANSTGQIGPATNAALSDVTEHADQTTTTGNGGGIGLITGNKATAGSSGNTTATITSQTVAMLTVALKGE